MQIKRLMLSLAIATTFLSSMPAHAWSLPSLSSITQPAASIANVLKSPTTLNASIGLATAAGAYYIISAYRQWCNAQAEDRVSINAMISQEENHIRRLNRLAQDSTYIPMAHTEGSVVAIASRCNIAPLLKDTKLVALIRAFYARKTANIYDIDNLQNDIAAIRRRLVGASY